MKPLPLTVLPEEFRLDAHQRYQDWYDAFSELQQEADIIHDEVFEQFAKRVLLASDYAYHWLVKRPTWLMEIYTLSQQNYEAIEQSLKQALAFDSQHFSEFDIKHWLRLKRHFWLIALAAFDLSQLFSIRKISYLQSLLANHLIQVANQWSYHFFSQQYGVPKDKAGKAQSLVILTMGKLGGMELNFSSDIDLIFCYPSEGETDSDNLSRKPIDNHKFFTRMGQKLIALLHETTADGFVHRVDMRLRPYGQSGALALSFGALADYYLEQGREWERFAMIKANVLSQEPDLAKAIEAIIRPFSFRRYIDFSVLDAIRQLKQKIVSEMQFRQLENNIKLGLGGIRELEFIVQSLQLISGGRFPELQSKNWWFSIEALVKKEFLDTEQANKLAKAYEFLRKLENRLQFRSNQQTQTLPESETEQAILAWSMGFAEWTLLEKALTEHQLLVENFFKQLFQDPNEQKSTNDRLALTEQLLKASQNDDVALLKDLQLNSDVIHRLQQFRQQFVEDKLEARGRRRLNELLPHLALLTSSQKEPLASLNACLSVLESIGRRTAYFELLAENLPLLEHLVQLTSRSQWLVEQLKQYPSLLDELLFPANFGKILTKTDLQSLLQQALLRIEPDNIEEQLLAIGRFKVANQFKVAAGFLNHRFNILDVTRQLTDVAELCLQALLRVAWQDLATKYGLPPATNLDQVTNFMVLGYGKLGSHELGFGSDLDLVFLYQGEPNAQTNGDKPIEVSQFYTRLTQKLVHYLNTRTQQGIMYEVDTRLRPSGQSGLLVSEFNAFVEYQQQQAWTWEKQALVRARAVAGDEGLADRYRAVRRKLLVSDQPIAQDVMAMRKKMRQNLDRTNEMQWDIKQGQGGMVDIEFLVQYWILDLAQKGTALADIYSNHYWLNWLEKNQYLTTEKAIVLKQVYEQYQTLVNQKRLDMEAGIIETGFTEASQKAINAIWTSTFGPQALQ